MTSVRPIHWFHFQTNPNLVRRSYWRNSPLDKKKETRYLVQKKTVPDALKWNIIAETLYIYVFYTLTDSCIYNIIDRGCFVQIWKLTEYILCSLHNTVCSSSSLKRGRRLLQPHGFCRPWPLSSSLLQYICKWFFEQENFQKATALFNRNRQDLVQNLCTIFVHEEVSTDFSEVIMYVWADFLKSLILMSHEAGAGLVQHEVWAHLLEIYLCVMRSVQTLWIIKS
jgi:hypothetical protein